MPRQLRNVLFLCALLCTACSPNLFGVSSSRSSAYEASDEIAEKNPEAGKRTATVELDVDPELEVVLIVSYTQEHRQRTDGCGKTQDMFLQSWQTQYSKDIRFPVKPGNSVATLVLDDILPGKCGLQARNIWFSVRHRESGIRAGDGTGFTSVVVSETGILSLPRRQVFCYPAKPPVALTGVTTILRCDLADVGTSRDVPASITKRYLGPIALTGAVFALEVKYVSNPYLYRPNPSINTDAAR